MALVVAPPAFSVELAPCVQDPPPVNVPAVVTVPLLFMVPVTVSVPVTDTVPFWVIVPADIVIAPEKERVAVLTIVLLFVRVVSPVSVFEPVPSRVVPLPVSIRAPAPPLVPSFT